MKTKILFIFVFILCVFSVNAFASVEINDNYFYDPVSGTSCFFGIADTDDEVGIILTDENGNTKEYPSKIKTTDGRFGILLKDPEGILKDIYKVTAYSKKNGVSSSADKKLDFNPGIISADAYNIEDVVSGLKAGDVLLLESGNYQDINVNITASGTESKPIVVRSRKKGGAVFTGSSVFTVSGSFVTVAGIDFNGCENENCTVFKFLDCSSSRLTDCRFKSCGTRDTGVVISVGSKATNCRVDHNLIEDSRAMSIQVACGALSTDADAALNTRIDHNHFYDIHKTTDYYPDSINGFECIQTGTYQGDVEKLGTVVEYNRFENVIGEGSEIISNKSNGNIFRYNTFINCHSSPTIRKGEDCEFSKNYLINVSKGLRFYGTNHKISDNYFYNSGSIALDAGNDDGDDGYMRIDSCDIENNLIIKPSSYGIIIGKDYSVDQLQNKLPVNTNIKNNYFYLEDFNAVKMLASADGITYSGNKAVLKGAASIGDASSGFEGIYNTLEEVNGIFVPKDYQTDTRGLITSASLKSWWSEALPDEDAIFKKEPDEAPESYPNLTTGEYVTYYICDGDEINIKSFLGIAKYADGSSYVPSPDDIEYSFSTQNYFEKTGDVIKVKYKSSSNGYNRFNLYLTYKGVTRDYIKFYVYPKAPYNQTTGNLFDKSESYITAHRTEGTDYWRRALGQLEINTDSVTNEASNSSTVVLSEYTHKEGDFEFSCDITINEASGYTPHFAFLFGYKNYGIKEMYKLTLNNNGSLSVVGNGGRTATLNQFYNAVKTGEKQTLKVVKKGNMVVAALDGIIIAAAEVDEKLSGKFGFEQSHTHVKIENIKIISPNEEQTVVSNLSPFYERIDRDVISIGFNSQNDNGYVYRLLKDGCVTGFAHKDEKFTVKNIPIGEEVEFKIEAFDINGIKQGEGVLKINLKEPSSNEFFMISDVYSKSGTNGEYVSYYEAENRFLNQGSYPYVDRTTFWYNYIDESFIDSGYIKTANNDKNNSNLINTEEWLKFSINRSATVYIISHFPVGRFPWMAKQGGWTCEDNFIYTKDDGGNDVLSGYKYFNISGSTSKYVYYKHFDTKDGVKLDITLGGTSNTPSTMYAVVVKPDVMPERIINKKHFK